MQLNVTGVLIYRMMTLEALNQQRWVASSTGAGNSHKNYDQTVFIPNTDYIDTETVFIAGK